MTEFTGEYNNNQLLSNPEARVEALKNLLEINTQLTQEYPDYYHVACSSALFEALEESGPRELLTEQLSRREQIKPRDVQSTWTLERLVTTGVDMIAKERLKDDDGNVRYTDEYKTQKPWANIIKDIFGHNGSNNPAFKKFKHVTELLDVNRIRSERRSAAEFILTVFAKRWGNEPVNILDIGCSRGDLLLMTAMNEPHDHIKMKETHDDEMYTKKFNDNINKKPSKFGKLTGIDIYPPDDRLFFGEWFESNCLRFKNSENEKLVQNVRRFGSAALRQKFAIEQLSADFSEEDIGLMVSRRQPFTLAEKYHMIISSFVYDYFDRTSRNTAINHCLKRLAPNGLLIAQGFIKASESHPMEIDVVNSDKDGCTTLGLDARNITAGWQELFKWTDGGCTVGAIGKSALSEELWSSALTEHA